MLALALPLSFFLVMLETAIGSYIVLFLLDVYGEFNVRRALAADRAGKLALQAEGAEEEEDAEEDERPFASPLQRQRGGVTKGFLVFQGLLYLLLALLAYWFGSFFATPAVFGEVTGFYQQYPLDLPWLTHQFTPLIVFMVLLGLYNVLLWFNLRWPRWIAGGLTTLAGLATLLVIGMAYRPLAAASLGGVFTVGSIFAGALALGGVLTAMLLGHWYLNTPTASGKPLEFATLVLLIGLVLELVLSFFIHGTIPGGLPQTGRPPISPGALEVIRLVFGFVFTLGLGTLAYRLTRGRSFQSATGMLYLAVAFAFTGEIMTRGLFFLPPTL